MLSSFIWEDTKCGVRELFQIQQRGRTTRVGLVFLVSDKAGILGKSFKLLPDCIKAIVESCLPVCHGTRRACTGVGRPLWLELLMLGGMSRISRSNKVAYVIYTGHGEGREERQQTGIRIAAGDELSWN